MAANHAQAGLCGPHSFDNVTASDLIIRSSDGYNFYVTRHIIEDASPVFKAILSAPHPAVDAANPGDYVGDKPVVQVEEGRSAVHWLLRCCYAGDHLLGTRTVYSVRDVIDLFHCLDKYEVQTARAEGEKALLHVAEESAFAAFAVACRVGLKDLAARIVESSVLRFTYDDEMGRLQRANKNIAIPLLDGPLMVSLWDYQNRYRNAAKRVIDASYCVDEELGMDRLPMWSRESTGCCPETLVPVYRLERDQFDQITGTNPYNYDCPDMYHFKNWFLAYLKDVEVAINQGPVLEQLTPTQPALRAAAAANDCPKCRTSFKSSFALFVELYKKRARSKVFQVCVNCRQFHHLHAQFFGHRSGSNSLPCSRSSFAMSVSFNSFRSGLRRELLAAFLTKVPLNVYIEHRRTVMALIVSFLRATAGGGAS